MGWREARRARRRAKGQLALRVKATDARWVCGDVTKFCGHGYHEDHPGLHCEGMIVMCAWQAPCLCPCHNKS